MGISDSIDYNFTVWAHKIKHSRASKAGNIGYLNACMAYIEVCRSELSNNENSSYTPSKKKLTLFATQTHIGFVIMSCISDNINRMPIKNYDDRGDLLFFF